VAASGHKVEKVTPKDIDEIYALWEAARLPARTKGRDTREHIARELAESTSVFLKAVLVADGTIVGVAFGTHDGRKGWINRLAVHPKYQKSGIAAELVKACEQGLRDKGIHMFAALIDEGNEGSMEFFKKMGYNRRDDIVYFSRRDYEDI